MNLIIKHFKLLLSLLILASLILACGSSGSGSENDNDVLKYEKEENRKREINEYKDFVESQIEKSERVAYIMGDYKYVIKELEKIPANNIITNKSNLKFIDSLKYNIGFNLLKIDTWHIWSAAFGMFKSIQEYDAYNEKLPSILFPLAQEMIDKNNIEKAKDVYFFLKDKYSNNREVNYIKFRIDSLKDENLYKLALNKYDEHKYRGVLSELNQMNKESHLAKEKQDLYSKIEKNIIDLANTKNSLESYYSNQFNKCGSHSNLRNKLYELGFAEIESYLGNSDDTQNTFIYVFHITNGDFNIELTEWRNYANIWIWKLNVENKYPEW